MKKKVPIIYNNTLLVVEWTVLGCMRLFLRQLVKACGFVFQVMF